MATRIEQEVQLLVEGNDERNFFEALIGHLQIANLQVQVVPNAGLSPAVVAGVEDTMDFATM